MLTKKNAVNRLLPLIITGTALLLLSLSCAAPASPEISAGAAQNPPKKLEIYVDYLCPHCDEFHRANLPWLELTQPQLEIRLRNYPFIDPLHSVRTAEAAECARLHHDPEYAEALFRHMHPKRGATNRLYELYRGPQPTAMERCVTERETKEPVEKDKADAQELGINWTPALVLDGELLENTEELAERLQ